MTFTVATFNALDRLDAATLGRDLLDTGETGEAKTREAAAAGERLYRAKIRATAAAVRRLDADVIAFQEVHGVAVLDDVRALLPARDGRVSGGYLPAIAGPGDRRGIACGLLTRFPVTQVEHHADANLAFPAFVDGDPVPFAGRLGTRRGVLEVVLTLPDGTSLHVLAVHLKSKLASPLVRADGAKHPVATMRDLVEGQVRAEIARLAEALHLRGVVDRTLDLEPGAQLAVCGDFNDTARSLTVRVVAGDGATASRAAYDQAVLGARAALAGRALHSCGDGLRGPAETITWRGVAETIDHVLVSDALWSRFAGADVHNERLGEVSAALGADGSGALESDHAPLLARFV